MEELDHIQSPTPVYARPAGLGTLGSESYIIEPYRIRSPHRVHIGSGVGIGARSFLSVVEELNGVRYEPELRIGDDCSISTDLFVHCTGGVYIGDQVGISARVFIGDSARDYENPEEAGTEMIGDEPRPIHIHDRAIVGVGAIILPGVTIGERGFVTAGSVVTRDVPPRSVVFGNPARVVRWWDEETGEWRTGPRR